MKKIINYCIINFLCLLVFSITAKAQFPDLKLNVENITDRLITKIDKVPANLKWPPNIVISDISQMNAMAQVIDGQPIITINSGITKVTDNVPDRMAYIVAHELIHIIKGHCSRKLLPDKSALASTFSNADEKEADIEGLKLLQNAGYSCSEAINTFKLLRDQIGDYSPLEAQSTNHPSWTQRLSYIDKEHESLWCSMSAFQNGVSFLLFQNYNAAIECFNNVVREYPDCYEAYTNLGYAYLMQYFDLFDADDIEYFGIGQLVTGGFYRRPQTLESAVRGINTELWFAAKINFEKALSIKKELSLAKSYLGITYFLDPEKKSKSMKRATEYLEESILELENDKTTDLFLKATLLSNTSAVYVAMGNFQVALSNLEKAGVLLSKSKKVPGKSDMDNSFVGVKSPTFQLENAIQYNVALVEYRKNSGSLTPELIKNLLRYLRTSESSAVWWQTGYRIYKAASVKVGQSAKSPEEILTDVNVIISPVKSVIYKNFTIYLSQDMKEITSKFKNLKKIPIVDDGKIYEYIFPGNSLSIIGGEYVIGIKIKNNMTDLQFGTTDRLYTTSIIGQSFDAIKKKYDGMLFSNVTLPGNAQNKYYFVIDLGIAFEVSTSLVKEIFIVQKPIN
jgi:tetratricopeptide (TPR) repeat protein